MFRIRKRIAHGSIRSFALVPRIEVHQVADMVLPQKVLGACAATFPALSLSRRSLLERLCRAGNSPRQFTKALSCFMNNRSA
jgi:hypothetical protein